MAIDIAFDAELGKIIAVDSAVDDIKSSAIDTGSSIDDLASTTESAGSSMLASFESLGSDLQSAGTKMSVGLTAPLMALGTAAVMTVSSFDDSMSKVQAISGATSDEFRQLREMALDLGSTTAWSASEAADAMTNLATAGWDTNQILAATPEMLSLASAGSLDLATAASITTGTMSVFSMEAERAGETADMFAVAAASADTNVFEIGEAMKYAGGSAVNMNMDLAQTNAVLATFANQSLVGSAAGTAFTAIFSDLSSKAEDGAVKIGKTSVAVYDASGAMRDMGSIMADVEKATDGMTDAKKDAALQDVFGIQSMRGVNIMLSEGSEAYKEMEAAIYDSEGAAAEMAETMEDNIGGAFRGMGSAIEGFMIVLGDELKPHVQAGAEFITDLAGKFGKLSDNTRKFIVVGGAIVAAIGPALVLFGTLLTVIGPAIAAITGPVGIAVAVIAGLVTAGIALYQNWDTIKSKAAEVFPAFAPLLETVKGAFRNLVDSLGPMWENLKGLFESLKPILTIIGGLVGGTLAVAFGIFISTITAVVSAIGPFINAVINIVDIVVNMVNVVVSLLTGDFAGAWEYLGAIGQSTVDLFLNLFDTIVTYISTFVTTIIDFFYGLYMTLVGNSIIPDIVNEILEWFVNLIASGIELVASFVTGIINGFINLVVGIGQQMNNAYETIISIWDTVMSFFSEIDLFQVGVDILQGLIDGIGSMASSLWSKVTDIGSGIADKFKSVLSIFSPSRLFKRFGIDTMLGYTIGFENEAENAIDASEQAAHDVSDAFDPTADDDPYFPTYNPKGNGPTPVGEGMSISIGEVKVEVSGVENRHQAEEYGRSAGREFKKTIYELIESFNQEKEAREV